MVKVDLSSHEFLLELIEQHLNVQSLGLELFDQLRRDWFWLEVSVELISLGSKGKGNDD